MGSAKTATMPLQNDQRMEVTCQSVMGSTVCSIAAILTNSSQSTWKAKTTTAKTATTAIHEHESSTPIVPINTYCNLNHIPHHNSKSLHSSQSNRELQVQQQESTTSTTRHSSKRKKEKCIIRVSSYDDGGKLYGE